MRIRHALAIAAAALLLGTTTAAHAAGPPYNVAVGSSTSGTQPITFTSSGAVHMSFENSAGTIVNMNCTSITGNGVVQKGTGVNPVVTTTSTTWNGCVIPGGPATVTQNGTWNITGTGSNATSGTETIAGYIGNVSFGVAMTAAPSICSFTVTGKMDMTFNEATQQILVSEIGYSGDLKLSNVGPCLGQLQNGNAMNLLFTADVSTGGAGAINVS